MGASGCSFSSCFARGLPSAGAWPRGRLCSHLPALGFGRAGEPVAGCGGVDVRLSAPRGLCWEELKVRKQVAEGTEEEVWCGQPPWEDAALSDGVGGERWLFLHSYSQQRAAWGWGLQSRQSCPLNSSNPP